MAELSARNRKERATRPQRRPEAERHLCPNMGVCQYIFDSIGEPVGANQKEAIAVLGIHFFGHAHMAHDKTPQQSRAKPIANRPTDVFLRWSLTSKQHLFFPQPRPCSKKTLEPPCARLGAQDDHWAKLQRDDMAMVQNQWYHFGIGAPPILEPILVGIGMFTGVRFGF